MRSGQRVLLWVGVGDGKGPTSGISATGEVVGPVGSASGARRMLSPTGRRSATARFTCPDCRSEVTYLEAPVPRSSFAGRRSARRPRSVPSQSFRSTPFVVRPEELADHRLVPVHSGTARDGARRQPKIVFREVPRPEDHVTAHFPENDHSGTAGCQGVVSAGRLAASGSTPFARGAGVAPFRRERATPRPVPPSVSALASISSTPCAPLSTTMWSTLPKTPWRPPRRSRASARRAAGR